MAMLVPRYIFIRTFHSAHMTLSGLNEQDIRVELQGTQEQVILVHVVDGNLG